MKMQPSSSVSGRDVAPSNRLGLPQGLFRATTIAVQVCALVALWFVSDALVRLSGLPLPAGVVGLFLLLGLLLSGKFAPRWIKTGADWMLSEMLLFFVPSAVAVMQYGHLIESEGLRLALVVVPGTLLVMCVTALAVGWGVRLERRILLRRLVRERGTRADLRDQLALEQAEDRATAVLGSNEPGEFTASAAVRPVTLPITPEARV